MGAPVGSAVGFGAGVWVGLTGTVGVSVGTSVAMRATSVGVITAVAVASNVVVAVF